MKIPIKSFSPLLTSQEIQKLQGEFIPRNHYHTIITTNHDIYDNSHNLICKFRKSVIPITICKSAYAALETFSKRKNYNRGAAGGKLNINKLPYYAKDIAPNPQIFRTYYMNADGNPVKNHISNMAQSNIAGYYDKPIRGKRIQTRKQNCRTTYFTKQYPRKWLAVIPLLLHADRLFKELVPAAHTAQTQRAGETPDYRIADTAFSTITMNYNWRTACHRDSGDFHDGFGNLIVLERDGDGVESFKGCFIGFPQFGFAVDVREGDFLAMNVHQWHCNTEFEGKNDETQYGRLSIVAYLRENMIKCKK